MAEFLIKAVDATHKDPVKDQRGCYKRGDVVQVYEDGECREKPSPNSRMVIIKIPGVPKAEFEKYTEPEISGVTGDIVRRRKFRLRVSDFPADMLQTLKNDKTATISTSQIKTYLLNKTTGVNEA